MIEIDFRNQIDKIKEQIDIVDLIGSRIELKPNNTARCPFHDDHNPSFSINVREQYWYCFSCAKGGDVIRFIELFDKKPFYEVLTELAEKVGISLKPLTPEQKQEFEDEKVIDNIREDTVAFYSGQLTDEAKKYLTESRKLTEVTITENRLGFARGGLQNFLVNEKGYSLELCIKASVLIKKEDGTIRDYFYQQVIIPTIKRGNVVYITGRILGDNKPSYFHQQGTRNYLYGEDNLSEEKVIIVEGFFDVLTIKQMDYPVVGLIGVSLNPTHLKKFSNCETALLLLDPDNAGENAIVKVGKLFGTRAKVLLLPDEQDPDEFFQAHTKEEIDEFLSKAQDFYSYQLQLIDKDTNKKELPKVLEPLLRQMSELNEILWGIYLDEIKVRFNLSGDERSYLVNIGV